MANADKKILYVDDERSLAQLGEEFLSDFGYQVVSAYSGAEALALFQETPGGFDLVVTDESMPGMCGIELAKKLYTLAPEVPVILCSGHLLTMQEAGMEQTNVRNVLVKTEVCTRLPDMIEALLG